MNLFRNAPWWLVSVGIHLTLVLGTTLVYVERLLGIETVIVCGYPPTLPTLPVEPERPRDILERRTVPLDTDPGAEEVLIFSPEVGSIDPEPTRELESGEFRSYHPFQFEHVAVDRVRPSLHAPGTTNPLGTVAPGYRQRFQTGRDGCPRYICRASVCESAVSAGLRWLARHQNVDGSWSADGFAHRCITSTCSGAGEADYDAGVTALSLLAFLGAGYSPLSKDELVDPAVPGQKLRMGDVVKRGLQWMIAHQDPEGCVGERGPKYMYNHAISALALSEAYGMTSMVPLLEPARKSIDFLVASQNPGKGWRYGVRTGENDSSVTGWAVMALKSAEISGLNFPKSAYEGALAWLNEASDKNGYYRTGYTGAGTGKVFVPGQNEQFDGHESMSAVAVMSRIFIQKKRDPALAAANLLTADLPAWKPNQVDFYYWYYASLALFQFDGPSGPLWTKWNEPMKQAIVPNQATAKAGCANGSWDPAADRWGSEGGRVYATAINCLTLEVYYRYANVFGTK